MRLNTLKPAPGSKQTRRRVGRGVGSGLGKTAGRGHKGQHARSGGYHKIGFEGGQMPLHRRLPKRGFTSLTRSDCAEVRTGEIEKLAAAEVDLKTLKTARIVPQGALAAKVILSGKLTRKVTLKGLKTSKGARAAIEAAGGKVEDAPAPVAAAKLVAKKKPAADAKPAAA